MALLVQDESGSVAGANAYIDAAFFNAYHDARGNSLTGFTTEQREQAIVRATDYLDQRFRFIGDRISVAQRTAWPRLSAEDSDGNWRHGVPNEIKEACAEYALIALTQTLNPTPTRDPTGVAVIAKSEKVGPLSEYTQYGDGGALSLPQFPVADSRLKSSGLVVSGRDLKRA